MYFELVLETLIWKQNVGKNAKEKDQVERVHIIPGKKLKNKKRWQWKVKGIRDIPQFFSVSYWKYGSANQRETGVKTVTTTKIIDQTSNCQRVIPEVVSSATHLDLLEMQIITGSKK